MGLMSKYYLLAEDTSKVAIFSPYNINYLSYKLSLKYRVSYDVNHISKVLTFLSTLLVCVEIGSTLLALKTNY